MILNVLTVVHVVLSLIGIGSGVVALYGLLRAKTPGRWTQAFLATTAATSITVSGSRFTASRLPMSPGSSLWSR